MWASWPANAQHEAGSIRFRDRRPFENAAAVASTITLRGRRITFIPQTVRFFNPLFEFG